MKKLYKTEYYQKLGMPAATYFAMLLAIVLIIIYLMKISQSKTFSLFLAFLMPILFIIVLIILQKKRIQSATLVFHDLSFSVILYDSQANANTTLYLWNDINAYRFYFDSKNNTCLTLYLKDKPKRTLIFNDKMNFKNAAKNESVFSLFYAYLKRYNLNQKENKIYFKPRLLATNTGMYIILLEVFLIIAALIIHFVKRDFSNAYYLLIKMEKTVVP